MGNIPPVAAQPPVGVQPPPVAVQPPPVAPRINQQENIEMMRNNLRILEQARERLRRELIRVTEEYRYEQMTKEITILTEDIDRQKALIAAEERAYIAMQNTQPRQGATLVPHEVDFDEFDAPPSPPRLQRSNKVDATHVPPTLLGLHRLGNDADETRKKKEFKKYLKYKEKYINLKNL